MSISHSLSDPTKDGSRLASVAFRVSDKALYKSMVKGRASGGYGAPITSPVLDGTETVGEQSSFPMELAEPHYQEYLLVYRSRGVADTSFNYYAVGTEHQALMDYYTSMINDSGYKPVEQPTRDEVSGSRTERALLQNKATNKYVGIVINPPYPTDTISVNWFDVGIAVISLFMGGGGAYFFHNQLQAAGLKIKKLIGWTTHQNVLDNAP